MNPEIKTLAIKADFSSMHEYKDYEFIAEKLLNHDVAVLVVNAGVASTGPFEKIDAKEMQNMIAVNVSHVLYTTKVMTNQLLNRKEKVG